MKDIKEEVKSWASVTTVVKFFIAIVAFAYIVGVQQAGIKSSIQLTEKAVGTMIDSQRLVEKRIRCLEDWKLKRETALNFTKQ